MQCGGGTIKGEFHEAHLVQWLYQEGEHSDFLLVGGVKLGMEHLAGSLGRVLTIAGECCGSQTEQEWDLPKIKGDYDFEASVRPVCGSDSDRNSSKCGWSHV